MLQSQTRGKFGRFGGGKQKKRGYTRRDLVWKRRGPKKSEGRSCGVHRRVTMGVHRLVVSSTTIRAVAAGVCDGVTGSRPVFFPQELNRQDRNSHSPNAR